jgi:hypothetical protein
MPEPYSPASTVVDDVTAFEDVADKALDDADRAASLERIVAEVGRAIVMQLRANRALQERELVTIGETIHDQLGEVDESIARVAHKL